MKKDINATTRAVDAAVKYLLKHRALEREAPKVIGRDVPVCPPMEEPLWDYHKDQYGFIMPDRLVRWAQVA